MKVLIVGGVAGGASAAARLRRNDENAQIILFERGSYISFANCGLPYYIGSVIHEKENLTLQTPESFRSRFNVDVRVENEVVAVLPAGKKVRVRRVKTGETYEESYDKLILSPGASPMRPPLPGFDGERVFTLRNIPDTYRIKEYCDRYKPARAAVIGGGYIGVEMAENLAKLGIAVTIVEMAPHLIAPIDPEMAAEVHNHLRSKGVRLVLGQSVGKIEDDGALSLKLSGGGSVEAELVILAVGVRPESALAKAAGLATDARGGIVVDDRLRTSDPDIYAVGDAVEVTDFVDDGKTLIPLASPANKQGRIAADNVCGGDETYEATQGTAIVKIFDLTVAATGNSEALLRKKGLPYLKSYTFSQAHASYYPGGLPMSVKLLFEPGTGRILGAQAVGYTGVDKRLDVIATVMRMGGTVKDLTKLELSYAPPFSSAKDPVNMAGYVAENILAGKAVPFYPEDLERLDPEEDLLLDVRTEAEFENGSLRGAVHIPLDSLRGRLGELLPRKDKNIRVFCQIGLRGYIASRILMQSGFDRVENLSGGYRLAAEIRKDRDAAAFDPKAGDAGTPHGSGTAQPHPAAAEMTVDACGLSCPGPILSLRKAVDGAAPGQVITVYATDPAFEGDARAWCSRTGNEFLGSEFDGKRFTVRLRRGSGEDLQRAGSGAPAQGRSDKSMVVFSGDLDKAIAAFIIANGAASMGRKVHMFFTFWGLNILRRSEKTGTKKDVVSSMFGRMMPRGSLKLGLSKMNMGGMGSKMIRGVMRKKNISSLEELMEQAIRSGVEITACSMSMDVMGIRKEELIDGVKIGGVASFLASSENSDATLFI